MAWSSSRIYISTNSNLINKLFCFQLLLDPALIGCVPNPNLRLKHHPFLHQHHDLEHVHDDHASNMILLFGHEYVDIPNISNQAYKHGNLSCSFQDHSHISRV